jgi:TrmH family RNA methyltransferase
MAEAPPAGLVERYRAARRDPTLAVLEGFHALKHALRFGAEILDARTRDPDRARTLADELAPDVAGTVARLAAPVDPDLFDALAPAPHPTGVLALARRPAFALDDVLAHPSRAPMVLLERPTHHGNIGAVVRVAAAAGAAAVLVTGPHDPWHPASIRGGAGLQFALPVAHVDGDGVRRVLDARPAVALDPEGDPLGPDPGFPDAAVLVFGSERRGVSQELLGRAGRKVSIPMRDGVSSLNLATAVAVTLYLGRPTSRRG